MPMTVSVSSGRGDGKHNTRVFIAENVDESRIKDDVIFRMPIDNASVMPVKSVTVCRFVKTGCSLRKHI